MSEWSDGYRRALVDVDRLAHSRGITLPRGLIELLADLDGDALVVEREQDHRIRRRRLAAVRDAVLPFDEVPP